MDQNCASSDGNFIMGYKIVLLQEIIITCQLQFHFLNNSLMFPILAVLWQSDLLVLFTFTVIVTVTLIKTNDSQGLILAGINVSEL